MIEAITYTPLFCIILCIIGFQIGLWIQRKTQIALLNPLMIAIIVVITALLVLDIPLEVFKEGTATISIFLGPATVILAVGVYRQRELLKSNILPILIATGVGAVTAVTSVVILGELVGLDQIIINSLMPKSVTTPIAVEIANQFGGISGITITAVLIAGITGAVIAPNILRLCRINNEVAMGLAIGTSSHALGTTKAIQLGEIQGAMSGIAIGITGIFTVIISLFV